MQQKRLVEIDFLRGIAVLLMVLFHFLFDYNLFIRPVFDLYAGSWFWLGRAAAFLFVFLAGLSLHLRVFRKNLNGKNMPIDFLERGLFILSMGALITLFTLVFFPSNAIWFGVLHLIGLSTILSVLFVQKPRFCFLAGAAVLVTGLLFSTGFLFFLALPVLFPVVFQTFDYFPLFPWFGIFLLGISAGTILYPAGKTRFWKGSSFPQLLATVFSWMGKNSLAIYFLHQPVLVGLLLLATRF